MYVLSKKEMYQCDHYTINELGIPGAELMENAGKNCSLFIHKEILNPQSEIIVFCGHGNNGGDGFVIARYLKSWGHNPIIAIIGEISKMTPATKDNYEKCLQLGIEIIHLNSIKEWHNAALDLNNFNLIIDAVFGIGFKGDIIGWIGQLIIQINQSNTMTTAIDIASGLNADNGLSNLCFQADYTLTMAAFKYGHLLDRGREFSGETFVIDIGVPSQVFEHFKIKSKLITEDAVFYPERSRYSHKGNYGKIAIIAGSPGLSGAAIMSSKAALRSGAGLITLFHPKGMEAIFETTLIEVMTKPIPDDIDEFFKLISIYDTLLIGPGIGVNCESIKLLENLLKKWDKPMVLDADAINIVGENPELKKYLKGKLITPHLGEFSRLSNIPISKLKEDRIKLLKDFTSKYECSVLLKSATTIFCDRDNLDFELSGNDGLSTGGSGDILAGIIVSFLGQKSDYRTASIAASYLMGSTAEKLAEIRKPASIIPTDIIEGLFRY